MGWKQTVEQCPHREVVTVGGGAEPPKIRCKLAAQLAESPLLGLAHASACAACVQTDEPKIFKPNYVVASIVRASAAQTKNKELFDWAAQFLRRDIGATTQRGTAVPFSPDRQFQPAVRAPIPCGVETNLALGREPVQDGWYAFIAAACIGKRVLDVGCGTGVSLKRHIRPVASGVLAWDVDARLRPLVEGIGLHFQSAEQTPLEELATDSYDVVLCIDTIEHVVDDRQLLLELLRIARETVFLTTPNFSISKAGNGHHCREYTPAQLLQHLFPDVAYAGSPDGTAQAAFFEVGERGYRMLAPEQATGSHLAALFRKQPVVPVNPPVTRPRRRELYVAGYPSRYGGADLELDHNIDLWRARGVEVTLVGLGDGPNWRPDPEILEHCNARGCKTVLYQHRIFADKPTVSFCSGPFLKRLPFLHRLGRPRAVLWFNCMTNIFTLEADALVRGCIDLLGYQTEYQQLQCLAALAEAHQRLGAAPRDLDPAANAADLEALCTELASRFVLPGYLPYYSLTNRLQQIRHAPPAVTEDYVVGRVSRDDAAKFAPDTWSIYQKITAPVPVRVKILGFGDNARKALGAPPPGLTVETFGPGGLPVRELYPQLHCLVHRTGGSRENCPRFVMEAWHAGVPVVVENDYGLPEMIENGHSGFLCNTADEMSFRASELAFDFDLRQEVIDAGRARLEATYANADRCWAAWETFFARWE